MAWGNWEVQLQAALVLDGALEVLVILAPPVVIPVDSLRWFGTRPLGMTFLNLVWVRREAMGDSLLRHEFAHVRQQKLFTPLGLGLVLLIHYGWLLLRYRSPGIAYDRSWIEKNAREEALREGPLPRHLIWGGRGR